LTGSKRIPLLLAVISAAFLYLCLFVLPATPRLHPGDQFINFENARRMSQGEMLYRDIFQYTLPGTELLELPLIYIFGAKLALSSALLIAVGVIDVLLAFVLASSVLSVSDAILASLFFLGFGFHNALDATHHQFSILFVYAATAVIIKRRSAPALVACGTLLGLATVFTQTRALVAIAVAIFVAWESRVNPEHERKLWRNELRLLVPFVLVVAAASAYVVGDASWEVFYRDVVKFPILYYRSGGSNSFISSLFQDYYPNLVGISRWIVLKLALPAIYPLFAIYYWRAAKRGADAPPRANVLLAVVGFALLVTFSYAPLYVRLGTVSLPAIIIALWMLRQTGTKVWRPVLWAATVLFLVWEPIHSQMQPYWLFDSRAGRLAAADPDTQAELAWLTEHTRPGEKFFATSDPVVYILMDLQNPTALPFIEPNDYTRPYQVLRLVKRLQEFRPRYIYWSFQPGDADQPGGRLYPLSVELHNSYQPVKSLNGSEIWELKPDPRQ